ncbi:MAG: hypothetical protein PSN37_00635 [Alphaproteobacteria bacterium]|nr:hypothetical protein [Alphaproteobacteria bacterium]
MKAFVQTFLPYPAMKLPRRPTPLTLHSKEKLMPVRIDARKSRARPEKAGSSVKSLSSGHLQPEELPVNADI